jgi:hypothetical protein
MRVFARRALILIEMRILAFVGLPVRALIFYEGVLFFCFILFNPPLSAGQALRG